MLAVVVVMVTAAAVVAVAAVVVVMALEAVGTTPTQSSLRGQHDYRRHPRTVTFASTFVGVAVFVSEVW